MQLEERPDHGLSSVFGVAFVTLMLNTENNASTLEDLAELGEGNSVTASYYPNNLIATEIDAQSP